MRSIAIVFLLLVTAWTAAAQKVGGNDGTLVLKNGTLVLNGVKLKTSESIIAVLGEEVYRERWKPAVSMRSAGIPLMAVGSVLLAWGMYGYITALTSEWPQAEQEPERWKKMNTAYNITKIMSGGRSVVPGCWHPLVLHRQWPYEEHPGQLQPRPRCFFGPRRPGAVLQVLRIEVYVLS